MSELVTSTLLKILLPFSGALILTLLAIIGYFLKQQIEASNALTKAVNMLTQNVIVLQSKHDNSHPVIDKRLDSHSTKLDKHELQINTLEIKIGIKEK